ncbi:phosphotransferase [Nonomuraea sp. NPDC050547]|uniref:phosphotransferase n=1 Tax=Nonomuraea sp. NPDC050547 TaxID=3364368 RepID=UPI0037AF96BC
MTEAAWRDPPSAVQALAAAGIDAAGAEIVDLSRFHDVRLAAGHVVKRLSRSARDSGRDLAAELLAYRLAGWNDALAAAVPRAVLLDERAQVLVIGAAGRPLTAFTAQSAASLGELCSGWHRATSGLPIPPTRSAGILRLPDTSPEEWALTTDAARGLGARLAADPLLSDVLREGAAAWRAGCLVHGDLKADNCVVAGDRIRVIDWELSGLGDPAWDVACVIADQLAFHTGAHIPAFVDAYGASGDSTRRRELFTIARLAHLALEQAEHTADPRAAEPAVELALRLATTRRPA